jgi:hypothetical protein
MKKKLFAALLLMGGLSQANAQSYKNAFSFNLGVTQDGIGTVVSHHYYFNLHDYIETSFLATDAKYNSSTGIEIPYNDYSLNIAYSKNLLVDNKNSLSGNISAGVVLGYESFNNKALDNGTLINSKPGFIYGASLGIDIDYVLNDKLSLFIKANEYYHVNSDLGKFVPFAGLGLRFYSN